MTPEEYMEMYNRKYRYVEKAAYYNQYVHKAMSYKQPSNETEED